MLYFYIKKDVFQREGTQGRQISRIRAAHSIAHLI